MKTLENLIGTEGRTKLSRNDITEYLSQEGESQLVEFFESLPNRGLILPEVMKAAEHDYHDYLPKRDIVAVYRHWVDPTLVSQRPDNFLDKKISGNESWQDSLTQKLVEILLSRGTLVGDDDKCIFWQRYYEGDSQPVFISKPEEDEWGEFVQTDHDAETVHGVRAYVLYGDGDGGWLRYEVSIGKFLRDISD